MPSHTFAVTLFGSRAVFSGMQLAKSIGCDDFESGMAVLEKRR